MVIGPKLTQKLSQSLQLTPQLQMAIKLLQLGRIELLAEINKELEENPLLELENQAEAPVSEAEANKEAAPAENLEQPEIPAATENNIDSNAGEVGWEELLGLYAKEGSGSYAADQESDGEESPSWETRVANSETLEENLYNQLKLNDFSDEDQQLIGFLIGNLNADGYLVLTLEELADVGKYELQKLEKALSFLHSFEPPGVGARSLQECLILQLEERGMADLLEGNIVKLHLPFLERRRYDEIARLEKVSVDRVRRALSVIKTLQPYPGRAFSHEATAYVVPDLFIYKVGNEYKVLMNDDGLPKLRLSQSYLQMLRTPENKTSPQQAFLQEKLKAASWLLKSIHQRQMTIYRVAECIAQTQRDFLDYGAAFLKPLTLKDIANKVSLHESTISRVTSNKFAHTSHGVFELKFFFSNSITALKGDVSSMAVKERIKALILAESKQYPISDQAIADILKKENISLARRTVAKYREELGFPPSTQRK